MSEWIDVASQNALSEGEHVVVDVDGVDVAVFNLEGSFYAIEDVCSHDGAEIASGELQGGEIICPRHGARFCVKTGQVKSAPAYEDIACFKVRIENQRVQVRDDRWD
jgi:3-phenylpropionate/trans-cinnamate dioxygenase ferredoxin subunit